jgi:hypothetical protein
LSLVNIGQDAVFKGLSKSKITILDSATWNQKIAKIQSRKKNFSKKKMVSDAQYFNSCRSILGPN